MSYYPDVFEREVRQKNNWLGPGPDVFQRAVNARRRRKPIARKTNTKTTLGNRGSGALLTPTQAPEEDLWGTARRRIDERINPILAMISQRQAEDEARARQVAEATNTQTDAAFAAARPELQGIYNSGINQATTLEGAISASLKGDANVASADFAKKLADMGAPTQGDLTKELETTYQGANAANFARGMSDVGRLVSRGAETQAWLEKEPLAARQQVAADLFDALGEIARDYGDQRGEITAGIPGDIQDLYDTLFGQKQVTDKAKIDAEDRTEEQRRYKDKTAYDRAQDRRAERAAEKKANQEAILVAMEQGNKKEIARLQAADKVADRAWRAEQKRLDREASQTRTETTQGNTNARTQAQIDAANERARLQREAAANKEADEGDTTDTAGSAKRERARKAAIGAVSVGGDWTPDVLRKLKSNPNSANAIVNTAVNQALRAAGVNPDSATGKALRAQIRTQLAGRRWVIQQGQFTGVWALGKGRISKEVKRDLEE